MTLFLQYKVNNHILDDTCYLWWPSEFPGCKYVSACTEQRSAEFITLLYITLAMPCMVQVLLTIAIAIISISIIDHPQISYTANYL